MKKIIQNHIKRLKSGELSEGDFLKFMENFPYENRDDIKLDFHRKIRRGLVEAIYGSGKTPEQLEKIIRRFIRVGEDVLVTRVSPEKFESLNVPCEVLLVWNHSTSRQG